MERSAKNQDVANYEMLARYYDSLLMDEESFSLWLDYIEEEPFNSILELASGSGVLAGILKNKGYDIVASDISVQMKDASKKNYDGEYLILDMTDYKLSKTFDLVLCTVDSINYLNEDQLDSFFKCAYEHLNKNGRIIFDMHSLNRITEFQEEYIEEGHVEDVDYQWTIDADSFDNTITEHFVFYTDEGMIKEQHTQNVFDKSLISKKMNDASFDVRVIDDFIPEEKLLVIGHKR